MTTGNRAERRRQEAEAAAKTDAAAPTAPTAALLTLSSGVVLKLNPVSPFVLTAVVRKIPAPTVPRQYIEDKGREEENPTHPEYLDAMDAYQQKRGDAVQNVFISMGTSLHFVPDGFSGPDDTLWSDILEVAGIDDVPESGPKRYLYWVKYWATRGVGDIQNLSSALTSISSVPEEEVTAAAESFRSDA